MAESVFGGRVVVVFHNVALPRSIWVIKAVEIKAK